MALNEFGPLHAKVIVPAPATVLLRVNVEVAHTGLVLEIAVMVGRAFTVTTVEFEQPLRV